MSTLPAALRAAIERVCECDPGSTLAADRNETCDAVAELRQLWGTGRNWQLDHGGTYGGMCTLSVNGDPDWKVHQTGGTQ